MVSSELRKLFSNKLTLILMALLILANGLVIWRERLPGTQSYVSGKTVAVYGYFPFPGSFLLPPDRFDPESFCTGEQ